MSREIGQAKKIPRVAATTPANTGSCDPGTRSGLCLCAARARVALPGDPVRGGHGPAAPVGRTVQHAAPFCLVLVTPTPTRGRGRGRAAGPPVVAVWTDRGGVATIWWFAPGFERGE